jgi:hypothetical protein
MHPARVLWVSRPRDRPDDVRSVEFLQAASEADARATIESLLDDDRPLDAVVAAPTLPDGDGGAVLREVRDRWPDAACFLYGDLWAIPEGSVLPVCEFHPTSQTPEEVAESVYEAVRDRSHRPYPVFEAEGYRLSVVEELDVEGVRADLRSLAEDARHAAGVPRSVVTVVEDYTVRFVAASGDDGPTSIPRGDSFCAYAIEEPGVTVVSDMETDGRLAHVPDPCPRGYRSYAARPLWVDRVPVGTFVLTDESTGAIDDGQLEDLSTYADEAQQVLDAAR